MSKSSEIRNSVEIQPTLKLEYNFPIDVPPNFSAVCNKTTQAKSILQVENLSTSYVASFYADSKGLNHLGTLSANDPSPWQDVQDFGGSKLEVANLSTRDATIRVTLRSA